MIPEKPFTASQCFSDRASFHRVRRNGSQMQPMKFAIASTVRQGNPDCLAGQKVRCIEVGEIPFCDITIELSPQRNDNL
jgi:hypothetical protein